MRRSALQVKVHSSFRGGGKNFLTEIRQIDKKGRSTNSLRKKKAEEASKEKAVFLLQATGRGP